MSPLDVTRPQARSDSRLDAGECDHVDERSAGKQVVDGGSVYTAVLGEHGDRQLQLFEPPSEGSGDVRHLRGARGSGGAEAPVGESPTDEVVSGTTERAGLAGHAASFPDATEPQSDLHRPADVVTLGVGCNPQSREREWEARVHKEVGRRVHRVIAHLAAAGDAATPDEILDVVREMWRRDPVGGSVASSARLRCSTAASVYLHRFMPRGWELLGHEVVLEEAVADLVWCTPDAVVIDEVKTGEANLDQPKVADQARRLAAGGRARWGDRFVGVRLLPLGAPRRASVVTLDDAGGLVPVPTPAGMVSR